MCGTYLAEHTRRARKIHRCSACNVPIPVGAYYMILTEKNDSVATSKWHMECREEFNNWLHIEHEDCGDPWMTWENGMPIEHKKKYLFGPWENP